MCVYGKKKKVEGEFAVKKTDDKYVYWGEGKG